MTIFLLNYIKASVLDPDSVHPGRLLLTLGCMEFESHNPSLFSSVLKVFYFVNCRILSVCTDFIATHSFSLLVSGLFDFIEAVLHEDKVNFLNLFSCHSLSLTSRAMLYAGCLTVQCTLSWTV